MAVATLVPVLSSGPASVGATAVVVPFNFTKGVGATSFEEDYRLLENGEGRLTEAGEVLELEP